MEYLLIVIPQFTGKHFSNFSNLQRNITSTERLFILDVVLRRAARLPKASSAARPSTPKIRFYLSIRAVLDKKPLARLSTPWSLKQAIVACIAVLLPMQQFTSLRWWCWSSLALFSLSNLLSFKAKLFQGTPFSGCIQI